MCIRILIIEVLKTVEAMEVRSYLCDVMYQAFAKPVKQT